MFILAANAVGCTAAFSAEDLASSKRDGLSPLGDNACLLASATAEQFYNPLTQRTLSPDGRSITSIVQVPYLEFPEELALPWSDEGKTSRSERLLRSGEVDPLLMAAVRLQKKGTWHLRWFFHPDDDYYRPAVETSLQNQAAKKCPASMPGDEISHGSWPGLKTASRSVWVQDPSTHYVFSVKTSLGPYSTHLVADKRDKGVTAAAAARALCFGTYTQNLLSRHIVLHQPEFFLDTLAYRIQLDSGRDLALLFRELPATMVRCAAPRKTYIPRFALPAETAQKPAWIKPFSWREDVVLPDAKTTIEVAVAAAFQSQNDSAHGQNRLLQMEATGNSPFPLGTDAWRLTGGQGYRDLGDSYFIRGLSPANWITHILACKISQKTFALYEQNRSTLSIRTVSENMSQSSDQGISAAMRADWETATANRLSALLGVPLRSSSEASSLATDAWTYDSPQPGMLYVDIGSQQALANLAECLRSPTPAADCPPELLKLRRDHTP